MANSKQKRLRAASQSITGLRCARYLRCSTDDQASGDYTTIDTQDALTLQHVATAGATDAGVYADEGKTGTNLNRADWKRLLVDAQARKFDVVVCSYMSRLGRGDAYTIAEYLLREAGVVVVMVRETFTDDLAGYSKKAVTKFLDGMYPVQVRGWTMTRLEEMFDKGYHTGGAIPYGYKTMDAPGVAPSRNGRVARIMVVDEESRAVVVAAFQDALEQRSVRAASDRISLAFGAVWDYDRTLRLLTNRTYIGEYAWGDRVRTGPHEALIDTSVFDAVQLMLTQGAAGRERCVLSPDRDSRHADAYYLRGLVWCGTCKHPMTPKSATGRGGVPVHYYECLVCAAAKTDEAAKRINAALLHNALFGEIGEMAAHPWRVRMHIEDAMSRMPRPERKDGELQSVRKRLRDTERQLANLVNAIATSGPAVVSALARRIEALEVTRLLLVDQEAALAAEVTLAQNWRPNAERMSERLQAFSQMWANRADAERCEIAPLIIDRVEVRSRQMIEATIAPAIGESLTLPATGSQTVALPSLQKVGLRTNTRAARSSSPGLTIRLSLPARACAETRRRKSAIAVSVSSSSTTGGDS